jgi:hypothetical protein
MDESMNTLNDKLRGIEDRALRNAMSDWVAHEMYPALMAHGVTLHAVEDETVEGLGGYFDESMTTMAIALGSPIWYKTLLHEYNHMRQWVEGIDIWSESFLTKHDMDTSQIIDLWYDNKVELTEEQLEIYFGHCLAIELDCEKRTVEMIADYYMPISIETYAQEANAYLLSYSEFRRRRSWSVPGRAGYHNPEIVAAMPRDFVTHTYTTEPLPVHLQELFNWSFTEETK